MLFLFVGSQLCRRLLDASLSENRSDLQTKPHDFDTFFLLLQVQLKWYTLFLKKAVGMQICGVTLHCTFNEFCKMYFVGLALHTRQ
jgi:hypothetical protein